MFKKILLSMTMFLCLTASYVFGATTYYYIDRSVGDDTRTGVVAQNPETPWATCPGMKTKDGVKRGTYVFSPGDTYVFKGGETWTFAGGESYGLIDPLYSNDGTAESPVTYMSGDRCGKDGSLACNDGIPWGETQANLNGGCTGDCSTGGDDCFYLSGVDYNVIDGLKITNFGLYTGHTGIRFGGAGQVVKNCKINLCYTGISYSDAGVTSKVGPKIYKNEITNCVNSIYGIVGSSGIGEHPEGVLEAEIHENLFEGLSPGYGTSMHVDGIQLSGYYRYAWINPKIYRNQFRGVWTSKATSMVYLQYCKDYEIHNNLMAVESVDSNKGLFSPGALYLTFSSNGKVYNNTVASDSEFDSTNGMFKFIAVTASAGTVDIKNNVFSRHGPYAASLSLVSNSTLFTSAYLRYNNQLVLIPIKTSGYKDYAAYAEVLKTSLETTLAPAKFLVEYNKDGLGFTVITAPQGHTIGYINSENTSNPSYDIMEVLGFTKDIPAGQSMTANERRVTSVFNIDGNVFFPRDGGHNITTPLLYDEVGIESPGCSKYSFNCNSIIGDPLFVTLPTGTLNSGDFHLQPGSPAIGVGVDLGAPYNIDLDGKDRTGSQWSAGCYQYFAPVEKPLEFTITIPKIDENPEMTIRLKVPKEGVEVINGN